MIQAGKNGLTVATEFVFEHENGELRETLAYRIAEVKREPPRIATDDGKERPEYVWEYLDRITGGKSPFADGEGGERLTFCQVQERYPDEWTVLMQFMSDHIQRHSTPFLRRGL